MTLKSLVPIQLPADPTNALDAATKQYVDSLASVATLDARYVNVTGDTISSGALGFGSRLGQHLNIYGTAYAAGIQSGSLYTRTGGAFRVFLNGVHSDTSGDPGAGGIELLNVTTTSAQFKSNNLATELWTQSRGTNLVTNGTGLMQNNTNFSQFVYNAVENFAGSGSFTYDGGDLAITADEYIAVNPYSRYVLSYAIKLMSKTQAGETPQHYGYVMALDADRQIISAYHVFKVAGSTLTTLAADLNPGNTTITLTNATGWHNSTTAHARSIQMFPYTNAQGYVYPDYTYSRLVYVDGVNGMWNSGGISGNVITLRVPWAGPAYLAGTKVANAQSGGSYDYIAGAASTTPSAWTVFEGTIGKWDSDALSPTPTVGSVVGSDIGAYVSPSGFRYGTAYVQVGWLLSYNTPVGTAKNAIDSVFFAEIPHTFRAAVGTPPFSVTSTTVVPNLNADMLDGIHATSFLQATALTTDVSFRTGTFVSGGSGASAIRQISLGYGGASNYRHDILTGHDSGTTANNTLVFRLWKVGDSASGAPTNTVLTLGGALITAAYPVALPADPASALHAATKQYVDGLTAIFTTTVKGMVPPPTTVTGRFLKDDGTWATVSAGGLDIPTADARYVNVTGDSMTGDLRLNSDSGRVSFYGTDGVTFIGSIVSAGPGVGLYVNVPADPHTIQFRINNVPKLTIDAYSITAQGSVLISSAPTGSGHATRKDYVDTQDALRVLKTGDTINGELTVNSGMSFDTVKLTNTYGGGTLRFIGDNGVTDNGNVQATNDGTAYLRGRTALNLQIASSTVVALYPTQIQLLQPTSLYGDVVINNKLTVYGDIDFEGTGNWIQNGLTVNGILTMYSKIDLGGGYASINGFTNGVTYNNTYQTAQSHIFQIMAATKLTVANTVATLTVPLALPADPTTALQAVTKQYVDNLTVNAQTGTLYTLVLTDVGKLITLSNSTAITVTVPLNSAVAFPVGTQIHLLQINTGQVTVTQTAGVTVNATPTKVFRAQFSMATLIKYGTDTWALVGDT